MRGDSLRDLYAKVIAVVGLGVLAGAGALVDYWPTRGALPRVATATGLVTPPGPLPVPVVTTVDASPARPAPARSARIQPAAVTTRTPTALTQVTPPASVAVASPVAATPLAPLPVAHRIDLAGSTAIALAAPPVAPAPVVTPAPPPTDPFVAAAGDAFPDAPLRFAPPATLADDSDGFIVGAVKKTRDSIVRTGRKTGASIFDAFRFVGGKMKKALPGT